jgi:WD40 repeat protein
MKKLNKYIFLFLFLQFLNLYSQSEWTDWEGDKFPFKHLYTKYQSVRQILFSDDNKSIYVFYDDNFLRKFDFESGNLVSEKQIPFVNISCADFTKDGKFALIWYNNFITKDSSIIKYDIEKNKIIFMIKPVRYKDGHGFDMPFTEMSVKISPKGDQFTINYNSILDLGHETSATGIISLYNFVEGKEIIKYDTFYDLYVLSSLFSSDQKYFAYTAFSYYRYAMPNNTFMDFSYEIKGKCNGKNIDLACSKSYHERDFTTSVKDSFQMNLCQFSDDNKLLVGYKKTNNSLYFLNPQNDSLLNIFELDANTYLDMFSSCFSDSNNFYIFVYSCPKQFPNYLKY